jgi:hypothetical protein
MPHASTISARRLLPSSHYGDLFLVSTRRTALRANGAKPSDLPIDQASKFSLVLNLKTGKQLGINIPPNVLTLADELIE